MKTGYGVGVADETWVGKVRHGIEERHSYDSEDGRGTEGTEL